MKNNNLDLKIHSFLSRKSKQYPDLKEFIQKI